MIRVPLILVVILAVSLLALATFALSPVLMGSGAIDYTDFVPYVLISLISTTLGFAWLALGYAEPTRSWLVSLAIVAVWCIVIGLLTLFSNYSGRSYWAGSLREAEERAEQLRAPNQADSKGEAFPADYVRRQLDEVTDDIQRARESRDYKQTAVYLSLGMTLVGIIAAGKYALLFRRRKPTG